MRVFTMAAVLAGVCSVTMAARAPQSLNANDLLKLDNMLRDGYEAVKKNYYDPAFHGVDLDARFKEYRERLKAVPTMSVGFTTVAAFLDPLKDSHTSFLPPSRSVSPVSRATRI